MLERRRSAAIDGLIVVASYAFGTGPLVVGAVDGRNDTAVAGCVGLLAVLPLLLRRRRPGSALVGVAVVVILAAVLDVQFTPFVSNAGPAVAVAVYSVASLRPRRQAAVRIVAALVAMSAATVIALRLHPGDQDAVQLAVAAPAWLIGDLVRGRRIDRGHLREEMAQRTAEREARIRAEERLRVSREVHDITSHTLGMIAVRAGVARHLLQSQPAEAGQALAIIETASRAALTELREVLRHTRDSAQWSDPAAPTLGDLPRLIEGVREQGLTVDYAVAGGATTYDPVVETSAYRIVQEALTNVVRHAHASVATVRVRHDSGAMTVSVIDDGRAVPPTESTDGLGLQGMAERIQLLGGTLTTGPRPEGGFAVSATLPVGSRPDGR